MLRKINRKARKRVFTLIFLFVFLVSSQFLIFSNPVSATIQEEDISVEWGDNVYQNLPYTYSGTFYDDADFDFAWTTAKIQFEYIPDNTITYEHSITELDNSETQVPTNSSFQMVNGTHYQNGTLNTIDDDYHIFNSTYDKIIAEQPDDFTIDKGNSIYDGDLEFLDGNYTTFYFEEDGHYPATYSFTDDVVASYGNSEEADVVSNIDYADYCTIGTDDGTVDMLASEDGHRKILKLTNTGASTVHVRNDFSIKTTGTIELWLKGANGRFYVLDDVGSKIYVIFSSGSNYIRLYYGDGVGGITHSSTAYDGSWQHIKIQFDTGTDTYSGWLNNVLKVVDENFVNDLVSDGITQTMCALESGNTEGFYDAVAYSWDADYEYLGDNWYWINYQEGDDSFEVEDTATQGTSIAWIDFTDAVASIEISGDDSKHRKFVRQIEATVNDVSYHSYDSQSKNGWSEFWLRCSDTADQNLVELQEDGGGIVTLWISGGFIQYWDGGLASYENGAAATNNMWYHIGIQWYDAANDIFDLWIDDVLVADDIQCTANMVAGINRFLIRQYNAGDKIDIDAPMSSLDGDVRGDNQLANDPFDLEIEVNMNLNGFSDLNELYLVYAYLTNISQNCNYSIYNFDSSSYDVIENDVNLAFVNSYFQLNSSYYNATNDLILSFEMSNYTFTEFEMRLERLLVRKPSYLNFSTSVNFDTLTNLLQMDINSYQRSNITQLINMSIWNYTTSFWDYLDGASYTTTFQLLQWINATFSGYVDSNGDVLLMYYGVNITDTFRFELDALNFTMWRKTAIQYQKTLSLLGTWKYRFVLDAGLGTQHIVDWVYFNVIEQRPNFEGISESRYSTRWVLTSTATSGEKNIVYEDQLTSGYWDLSDYSSRTFDKFNDEIGGYLMSNSSFFSTFTYISVKYDTANPQDIFWDGTYWYLSDGANVREYDSDWVATGSTWGLGGWGLYKLDDFWYVAKTDNKVHKYTSAWVHTGTSYDLEGSSPSDLWYLNNYWYVMDFGSDTVFKYTSAWAYTGTSYNVHAQANYPYNIRFSDKENAWWILDDDSNRMYKYDTSFTYLSVYYDIPEDNYLYGADLKDDYWYIGTAASDDVYKYKNKYEISKNYFTTSDEGYAYFQSDTTETLGLISPQFSSKSLSEGDVFVVDLQTTSDNALLKLYSGGALQQTLNLLIGNTKTERQEVEVLVSEGVSFDRVKITSELTDIEYFKLYNIKAEHWVFEDEEDQRSMYVNPFGQNDLIANLGNNSLKIYEDNMLRTDTYVTISYDLLTHIFESTIPETVFVSFYDSNNNYLDFNQFTTYVNYTLYESDYGDQRLTSREFYVDEKSTIYFNVYDSFEVSIYNKSRLAKTFIDITLNVYTLKIKNEALEDASYTLTKGSVSKEGILFPDDIDEYQIASGNYTFSYIKGSDSEVSVNFDLTQNRLLKINRSRMCYLTYSNQRGEHLFFDNYKTYINGSLIYENIFYRDIGDIVGIEIKDRYDISIKNETYTVVAGDNYIPITLTMYSLKVMNQQEVFNHINITRDPNYYPDNPYYWSEWIAPTEIIEFKLFAGYYKINLTNNENGGSSSYDYTLNGDDVILITSGNLLSQVIYNIANVNTSIGNQITNVEINITNQNSQINNTIVNIEINIDNMNSSLGNLLTNINLDIININNNISNLYTFTENNFLNLGNNINNSFISIENNIIAINQTISTLVIGLDGKVTIVNATINTMFTEMNSQFIVVQSTLDFSFAFLNQTIIQIGNNITTNQIALNNLIIQRANDIDNNLIQITNLINLLNSTVANESLVVQTLVNIIGSNITENHVIINNLINLLGNNITENNLNLVSLIEVVGNNITTNQFVIQTLIDYVSNNITDNHLELLTNINFINNTMDQNQIELINRLLFINNSINQMALDLTNQIIFVNDTIYSAILSVSTSIDFNSDCILGNISLTYQQNDFLTELYKKTMFSQLLNWSDVAYNYSLMEDRIDVWEFINNYRNESVQVLLRYNDLIDNLTISAQNTIEQYLPNENVEYRLWSVANEEYLTDWVELPENRTVSFGFYEEEIPDVPDFNAPGIWLMIILILMGCGFAIALVGYLAYRYRKKSENYRRSYADKVTLEAQTIKKFSQGTRIR